MSSSLSALPGAALCLAVMFAAAAQAEERAAGYQLCNETSYVLDAALARPVADADEQAEIESTGWHRLLPGYCQTVLEGAIAAGTYYVYARSIDAHRGKPQIFGGDEILCIRPLAEEFALREHIFCRMNRPGQRGEKVGFAPVEADAPGWTTNFSPRQTFSSRRHAIVAGVQRLLEDNDYEIGTIDGFAGKVTLQAVKSFQRRQSIAATGIISKDLFSRLIAQAQSRDQKAGLSVCNDSDYFVWSAVGYRSRGPDPEFESNGWIRIPPHACRIAIHDRLEQAIYYIYAEARDEKGAGPQDGKGLTIAWEGDFTMCIAQTRFRIRGAARCAARGYQEARFRRVENQGATRFTERLQWPQ